MRGEEQAAPQLRRGDGSGAYRRWVDFVARRYRAILIASGVIALLSALSLLRLRLDLDILDMLPRGTPVFDEFRSFVAEFGELDELVILIEGDDPARLQSFADELATELGKLDSVAHVQARFDRQQLYEGVFGRYLYNYIPLDAYDEVARRLSDEGIAEQIVRDRAILKAPFDLQGAQLVRRDPLGFLPLAAAGLQATVETGSATNRGGYVSNADGTALLVMVRPTSNAFDVQFSKRLLAAVGGAVDTARARTDGASLQVSFTGSYAYAVEDEATIRSDIQRYVAMALLCVLAIFWGFYRSLRILPFITWPLVLSTLISFAASVIWYSSLNAVSTSFAAILYGLSIDSGVHYYTRFLQEWRDRPLRDAVEETLRALSGANVVASVTTAAVFMIIGFSALRGVSQLGSLTAVGMFVNIAQFFVLYPALSFAMASRPPSLSSTEIPRLGALARWCERNARLVAAATVAILVMLLAAASSIGFDSNLNRLRPHSSQAARTQDRIMAQFGGEGSAGAALIRDRDVQRALENGERAEQRLRAYADEGLLLSVRGISGLLPSRAAQLERLQRFNALPRADAAERIRGQLTAAGFVSQPFEPFLQRLATDQHEVIEPGDPALEPFAALVARHLRRTDEQATVGTYLEPAPGVTLAAIEQRLRRDLPDLSVVVTGRQRLEQELADLLRSEMVWFFGGSLLLNLLIIWAQFRDLRLSLILLTPPGLIVVACLALMAQLGHGVGPVNIIVIPLIIGIGVDNCVYLAERYLEGGSVERAARMGGRALCVSALTTMAGFGFLGLSQYPALSDLGWLSAACLGLCLIASVTVLPGLLALRDARTAARAKLTSDPSPSRER